MKLSVFVGSPKKDLEDIRQEIIKSILEAGHIPEGMELWASEAQPTLKTISDKLCLCDVHIVLLGANYGQILDQEEICFTEWEYNQSREAHRPIIAFLLEESAFEDAWRHGNPVDEKVKDAYRVLWKKLGKSVCRIYNSFDKGQIARDVLNALNRIIDSDHLRPHPGWIRAESKEAKLATTLQGNPFLLRVLNRVVGFHTTGGRLEKERNAKKAAAAMFWDTMMNRLARANYMDIFLESGSSLAYVSEAFESRLNRQQGWRVSTNNALSLFQLLLFTDGEIRRNPPVAPDPNDPYGAIFTLKCKQAYEEPHIEPRSLYPKELEAIQEIISLLKSGGDRQIILATASGWDTKHPVSAFRGPHVGSHPNMLFKRAIFMTGNPVVIFLPRHKVDPNFREAGFKCRSDHQEIEPNISYCYPVFGEEMQLFDALLNTPLALCIGYELEKNEHEVGIRIVGEKLKNLLRPELENAGFDFEYAAKEFILEAGVQAGAIIIANEKFCKLFPR